MTHISFHSDTIWDRGLGAGAVFAALFIGSIGMIVHVWWSRRGGASTHPPQIRVRSFAEATAQRN